MKNQQKSVFIITMLLCGVRRDFQWPNCYLLFLPRSRKLYVHLRRG